MLIRQIFAALVTATFSLAASPPASAMEASWLSGTFVASAASPWCPADSVLTLKHDEAAKTIYQKIEGTGTINGLPVNSEWEFSVDPARQEERISFPLRTFTRILVKEDKVVYQERGLLEWRWRDTSTLLEFQGPDRVMVPQRGYVCTYDRR